jgi:hypothetical protein
MFICGYLIHFNGFSRLSVEIYFGAGQGVGRNLLTGILFQRNTSSSIVTPCYPIKITAAPSAG